VLDLDVRVGGEAYAADPNDPEVMQEAIAGGLVWKIDDREGVPPLRCVRAWRGQVVWTNLEYDQVVVYEPPEHARAQAGNVYRFLCRNIGRDARAKGAHLNMLEVALLAAKVWAGDQ
jgi:hypothetical protein